MEPFELFGWTAGALLVARIVPQPWRIWRRGTSAGVSPVGVLCWLANDLGWLVYGWRADMTPIWVASGALVVLDLALVAMTSAQMRRGTVVSGLSWLVVVIACAMAGQGLLATALVAGSATGTIPHALHALRSVDLSGVSGASWLLASVDGLLWGVYGLGRRDLPSVVYAVLTLGTAAVILWRLQTVATTPAPPAVAADPSPAWWRPVGRLGRARV